MNKELATTIGYAARRARKALRLTQADVAERIDVSPEFYARIERGTSLPSILVFARIVAAIGADPREMMGVQGAPPPPSPSPVSSADSDEVRYTMRRVRKADPEALRLVNRILAEFERRPSRSEK